MGVRKLRDSFPHAPNLERPESLEVLQLEPHLLLVSRERDGRRMPANLSDDRQGRVDIAEGHLDSFHRDILAARGRPAGLLGSLHPPHLLSAGKELLLSGSEMATPWGYDGGGKST